MSDTLSSGSLVLYKSGPALVGTIDDKIEITMLSGKSRRVRDKDVLLLHPGPLRNLSELNLKREPGDLEDAWELIRGETSTKLSELAELAFGEFTPDSAWGAWRLLDDQLWFEGTPEALIARDREQIDGERARRAARAAEKQEREAFLERLKSRQLLPEDRAKLSEVEMLANGRSQQSAILQSIGIPQGQEAAHRFLVDVGYWPEHHNPYPARLGVTTEDPEAELPELSSSARLDLTYLAAFAIDDEGSNDPDDAISFDGDRIWVHVADVAALVPADSPLDMMARERGSNLYLPDRIVHMLPPAITHQLALGLQEISPALSFGFRLDSEACPTDLEINPSLVRVTRHTYAEADRQINQPPFAALNQLALRYRERRLAQGAVRLDLPEVRIRANEGRVEIAPLERLASREMVTELMLMAGEAVAQRALDVDLPLPFATQPPPERPGNPETLAQMFAFRRQLKPGRHNSNAELHAGLGLRQYTRATSPLRRYLDLVTHQQLHRMLSGETPLSRDEIEQRIAISEPAAGQIRRVERLSNTHWKLLWLAQNPEWRGEGVVVESEDQRMLVLIPELAMETRIRSNSPPPPDTRLRVAPREQELTSLTAWFRLL